jgi:hypothetical protein
VSRNGVQYGSEAMDAGMESKPIKRATTPGAFDPLKSSSVTEEAQL